MHIGVRSVSIQPGFAAEQAPRRAKTRPMREHSKAATREGLYAAV